MKKKIDVLVTAIVERLEQLPPTVERISTKKLLKSMKRGTSVPLDVSGFSLRSLRNAVGEAKKEGWRKEGRSFLRISANDKCKSSPISANAEGDKCKSPEVDPVTAELDRRLPKPADFDCLSFRLQQRWYVQRGEIRRQIEGDF